MAKKSGLGQEFVHHGLQIGADIAAMDQAQSPRGVQDVTPITSSAMERILLLSDGRMAFTVLFNDAAGQAHGQLSALPTTDVIMLWMMGTAIDDVAAWLLSKQVDYDWNRGPAGELVGSCECLGQGRPLEWGNMLTAGFDTQASSGTVASKDDSASSADGLAAVLAIDDLDSGTPTVTIEDSANDSTWATLVAFAAVADGAEPTSERVTVSGTVDRYLRLNITGTFVNLDYAVAYRRGDANEDEAL